MRLTAPIAAAEFAHAMAAAGPFEPAPHLAVGLSGGADSMALALLLHSWIRERGGRLLALTVDHGLRPESAVEATRVAGWMGRAGIDHRILTWPGEKPTSGIQAGARSARLSLLAQAAAGEGVLHLALAHHRDDQAETVHLRRERGSGGDGLAGMPLVREMAAGGIGAVRLIRPLLAFPKQRLRATCIEAGMDWVEDPSNRDPRYARAALRLEGHDVAADAQLSRDSGQLRAALDARLAALAATTVRFQPEGWVQLAASVTRQADGDGPRLLATLLRAVGGAAYPPSPGAVDALWRRMRDDPATGATLAGCRLAAGADGWRLMREERNLEGPVAIPPGGGTVAWDGRFRLHVSGLAGGRVQALDDDLWRQATRLEPALRRHVLPAIIRKTCPALTEHGEIRAIPHMGFRAPDLPALSCHILQDVMVPAIGPRFAVVSAANDII